MSPAHPFLEDLRDLVGLLTVTGEHAARAAEELDSHLAWLGDRAAQAAVDDLVDGAADVLHDLSASCRALALTVRAATPGVEPPESGGVPLVRDEG